MSFKTFSLAALLSVAVGLPAPHGHECGFVGEMLAVPARRRPERHQPEQDERRGYCCQPQRPSEARSPG